MWCWLRIPKSQVPLMILGWLAHFHCWHNQLSCFFPRLRAYQEESTWYGIIIIAPALNPRLWLTFFLGHYQKNRFQGQNSIEHHFKIYFDKLKKNTTSIPMSVYSIQRCSIEGSVWPVFWKWKDQLWFNVARGWVGTPHWVVSTLLWLVSFPQPGGRSV